MVFGDTSESVDEVSSPRFLFMSYNFSFNNYTSHQI